MDLSTFIAQYGYFAIALGCMLEGETVAVLGGLAANTQLNLPLVYLMAFLGGWLWDSIFFLIGHHYGASIIKRFPKYKGKIKKAELIARKYDLIAIIGLRFLYGLRTIGPMAIGIAKINTLRFIICNAVGAALWSSIFVTIGYSAGRIFQEKLQKLGNNIIPLLIIAAVVFTVFFIIRTVISRRHRQSETDHDN